MSGLNTVQKTGNNSADCGPMLALQIDALLAASGRLSRAESSAVTVGSIAAAFFGSVLSLFHAYHVQY